MLHAASFYLGNYREPKTDHTIESALPLFLEAKEQTVYRSQYANLRNTISRFTGAVPDKRLHEIAATDVED